MQSTVTTAGGAAAESDFSLFTILTVLARRKKSILGLTFAAACAAALISLAIPNIYGASATLLPPQQAQSSAGALLSQLGGAAGLAGGLTGLKNPNDLYVGMLKSRTVADRLVKRLDLKRVYETDSQEKARKILASRTTIGAGKDGIITIGVEDQDQKLVAPLANAYVAELTELTKVLAVTEAARRRMFYERQLETAKDQLASAEMKLKAGLESGGVVSVDSDSRAAVESVARLRAQVSSKEIQLGAMQAFVTPSNHEYRRVQEELGSLRAQLARSEGGRAPAAAGGGDGSRPGLENVKILRDVKYYQMLYELLAKQYEIARLDESKDSSMIQVLDAAVQPERKIKPARAIIVLGATVLAFLLLCALALLAEFKSAMLKNPEHAARLAGLKSQLRFR